MIVLESGPATYTRLLDLAVADTAGRLLVPFVDVLALAHLRVTDDIVLVEFTDSSSTAMTVRELLVPEAPCLELAASAGGPVVRLVPADGTGSSRLRVRAIHAMSFAEFVGRCR
jgi:hypothetical protein